MSRDQSLSAGPAAIDLLALRVRGPAAGDPEACEDPRDVCGARTVRTEARRGRAPPFSDFAHSGAHGRLLLSALTLCAPQALPTPIVIRFTLLTCSAIHIPISASRQTAFHGAGRWAITPRIHEGLQTVATTRITFLV